MGAWDSMGMHADFKMLCLVEVTAEYLRVSGLENKSGWGHGPDPIVVPFGLSRFHKGLGTLSCVIDPIF